MNKAGEVKAEQTALWLTSEEVAQRVAAGKVNGRQRLQTKSVFRIVRDNLLTLFNGVNIILAVLILWMSDGKKWNDVLFMGIVFFNLFVGIFQELRAKRTIEKLSLISAPKVTVLRDAEEKLIPVEELVVDEMLAIRSEIDAWKEKKASEKANARYNEVLNYGLPGIDGPDNADE